MAKKKIYEPGEGQEDELMQSTGQFPDASEAEEAAEPVTIEDADTTPDQPVEDGDGSAGDAVQLPESENEQETLPPREEAQPEILSLDITPLEPEPETESVTAENTQPPGVEGEYAPADMPEGHVSEQEVDLPSTEEKPTPAATPRTRSDRQNFFSLDFHELDRDLTTEERKEWNSIYASYRGRSALTGTIIGVDRHTVNVRDPQSGQTRQEEMYCAIVVPYRIRIVIPAAEMWDQGNERPNFVLQNMVGATIDFIIIKVDREADFAIASRRLAARARRYYFSRRPALHDPGAKTTCRILSVGPRRCLVECFGHDINLTQRELRYSAIPDLRNEYRPGQELECLIKGYDAETDSLRISVKETASNPFDGADTRHPVGCRRQAVISGKYGGGVFCNLPDGTVCMCSYSYQYDDADFSVGDSAIVVIQHYDMPKKQIYGKIISKW